MSVQLHVVHSLTQKKGRLNVYSVISASPLHVFLTHTEYFLSNELMDTIAVEDLAPYKAYTNLRHKDGII